MTHEQAIKLLNIPSEDQGHSEIFEEEGITISLIDCTYCDMPTNTLLEIYEGILLGDTDE